MSSICRGAASLWLIASVAALAEAQGIRVTADPMTFSDPIAPDDFAPSLKFDFDRDVRDRKIRIEIEVSQAPSANAIFFSVPASKDRAIEVTSVEPDVSLDLADDAPPGAYAGRLKLSVDSPSVTITPNELPFSFTIDVPSVKLAWEGGSSGAIHLGNVRSTNAGEFQGPKLHVSMTGKVAARVTFESEHPEIWLRPETGETLRGEGTIAAGTYQLMLDPAIALGTHQGKLTFSTIAKAVKINGNERPAEFSYDLEVSSPMATVMKYLLPVLGGLVVIALVIGIARIAPNLFVLGKKEKHIPVEGVLDFLVPQERRPEKLDRIGKTKVIVGQGGDVVTDAKGARFELAGFERGKTKVMELTRIKGTIYVNGVEVFSYELYHGDVIKLGQGPALEMKYVNPQITGVHVL